MTPILSVTFAPPTIATSGRPGSARMPVSVSTSRCSSRPGGRVLDVLDDADRRGVRAVRGAEGVVDVEVGERAEALGQLRVVLRLARLEADVLEHHDVAVGHVVEVRRELDVDAEQARQVVGDRLQRELRLAVLGPAEVRDEQELRAPLAQLLDRRQRAADAGVVGDRAVRRAGR